MQLMLDREKLSDGDVQEWRRLCCGYERLLRAQAYRVVRDAQDAEEVVQTVMLRLWLRRQRLPLIDNVEHYLLASVRNQARNLIRPNAARLKRVAFDAVMANEPHAPSHTNPAQAIEQQECLDTLEDVERMLTDVQRRVLTQLRHDPNLSSRGIAAQLGCSHKNVLGILRRIRRALAPRLFGT